VCFYQSDQHEQAKQQNCRRGHIIPPVEPDKRPLHPKSGGVGRVINEWGDDGTTREVGTPSLLKSSVLRSYWRCSRQTHRLVDSSHTTVTPQDLFQVYPSRCASQNESRFAPRFGDLPTVATGRNQLADTSHSPLPASHLLGAIQRLKACTRAFLRSPEQLYSLKVLRVCMGNAKLRFADRYVLSHGLERQRIVLCSSCEEISRSIETAEPHAIPPATTEKIHELSETLAACEALLLRYTRPCANCSS
jgi:hypothetical protein